MVTDQQPTNTKVVESKEKHRIATENILFQYTNVRRALATQPIDISMQSNLHFIISKNVIS